MMTFKPMAKALLNNYHALKQRRFTGDLEASDMLIDLDRAIKLAELSPRQKEAVLLYHFEELTQVEIAKQWGVAQKNISIHLSKAYEAIDEIYEYWAWQDGDITLEDEKEVE